MFVDPAGGDLTVSLTDGLATLEGIHLQLTSANLVCPNVQISGIDPSNINNITLQVTERLRLESFVIKVTREHAVRVCCFYVSVQIDPSILQQTLQQGALLSHSLAAESGLTPHTSAHLMATGDASVPANVVIHPLSGLSLQPTTASTSVTISNLTTEQDNTGLSLSHYSFLSHLLQQPCKKQVHVTLKVMFIRIVKWPV